MNRKPTDKCKVILASAGPGDPDLITVKALRYLQEADVVITDRLVSKDMLDQNLKAGAKLIYVGKQGGKSRSTPQEEINELLVEHATGNSLVVRLKGGDIAFFSNVLDEVRTLIRAGIPYEIVPGVTAASGASAYSGIPLTARGYATAVRFLTYTKAVTWNEASWGELAVTDDTLVFYMSTEGLGTLVKKLLEHNISSSKQLAVIEQATTPLQNVSIFSLLEFNEIADQVKFLSPTLIIIGQVVALHQEFKWIENNDTTINYFKPIADIIE